jgi:hypothetical protein
MADNEVLQNPIQTQEDKSGKKTTTFLGIPLQRWSIVAISGVAVLYAVGWVTLSLYQKYKAEAAKAGAAESKASVLQQTVDTVSQNTNVRISEADKHKKLRDKFDTIKFDTSAGHSVMAEYYPSDGCIHVMRTHGGTGPYGISDQQDLWIPDPSRMQASRTGEVGGTNTAVVVRVWGENLRQYPIERQSHAGKARLRLVSSDSVLLDKIDLGDKGAVNPTLKQVQAGCLNPHPWGFRSWWGPANGCIAPFYRQWGDGCTHYQIYNACNGMWDPQIYWTYCAGQHHP